MTAALVRVKDDYASGGAGLDPKAASKRHPALALVLQGLYDAITGTSGSQPGTAVFEARVASTGNLGLSGLAAIDGVTPAAGNIVLAKDQTTSSQKGLYVAAAGAWTRLKDSAGADVLSSGMIVTVSEGTVNADSSWFLATNAPITVGTTSLTFQAYANPATAAPADLGTTAAVGTSLLYARADHVHIYPAAQKGHGVLATGTLTISTAAITANSEIFVQRIAPGSGAITGFGSFKVTSVTPGAPGSFVITSIDDSKTTIATDNSTVSWFVVG